MASDGPEPKVMSQEPDQNGDGESSEQLTKFVSPLNIWKMYGRVQGTLFRILYVLYLLLCMHYFR